MVAGGIHDMIMASMCGRGHGFFKLTDRMLWFVETPITIQLEEMRLPHRTKPPSPITAPSCQVHNVRWHCLRNSPSNTTQTCRLSQPVVACVDTR